MIKFEKPPTVKKLLILLLALSSLTTKTYSQVDSVKLTITAQARDFEIIGGFAFTDNLLENLYDSLKVKWRVANPPALATTPVAITAYVIDWKSVISRLKTNVVAIKGGPLARIEALLRALNNTTLNTFIDAIDAQDTAEFTNQRLFGRLKLRRL